MLEAATQFIPGFYWLSIILYFEIVLRIATIRSFKNPILTDTIIWSAIYASVLMLLFSPFSSSIQMVFASITLLVLYFLYASQLVYYKIFKMFYTLFSMGNAGQILDFVKDIVAYVTINLKWILILALPPAAHFLNLMGLRLHLSRLFPSPPEAAATVIVLILAILLLSSAKLRIRARQNQLGSAYEAYHKSMDPTMMLRHFGLMTTMRLDFQRTVLGMKSKIYDDQQLKSKHPATDTTDSTNTTDTTNATNTTSATNTTTWPPSKYNALPIDFSTLAAMTTNESLKSLHNWFRAQSPSSKNAYTGRFKGYNLIFITAESMSPYSIHKDLTPTLYKMVHDGFHFTEFYNPIWGVSTSDGEYVACTGLLPKSGLWSFIDSADKNMAMTLGNQLRPLGYTTNAYHNHRYSYYKRHLSHPNMGYTYSGLGNGLNVTPTWPESDLEMMQLTVPQYVDHEPFHTYYMTVSGHMRYSFKGNAMAAKNRAAVAHLSLSEEAKAYLATQVELDRAMASLLDQLETAGVDHHTLIAMSADHYPYGLSDAALDELAGHKVDRSFELYRSPFILYTRGQTPEVITTPCSSLDILPTLSNLMGLDFDARLLMGRDIFSDSDPLVMFLNKSFITNQGRYDALNRTFLPMVTSPNTPQATNYLREVTETIEDKFLVSARILDLDYYKHLIE